MFFFCFDFNNDLFVVIPSLIYLLEKLSSSFMSAGSGVKLSCNKKEDLLKLTLM